MQKETGNTRNSIERAKRAGLIESAGRKKIRTRLTLVMTSGGRIIPNVGEKSTTTEVIEVVSGLQPVGLAAAGSRY